MKPGREPRTLRAQVIRGRLVMNLPTELPEGAIFDLVVDDEGDDLDANERRQLHARIAKSIKELDRGKGRPARDVVRELRKKR